MKKIIKYIPFITLLSLTSVLGLSNNQKVERADAVSTSYRYFIANSEKTYGIKKEAETNNSAAVSYDTLETIYQFVDNGDDSYSIKLYGTTKVLCYKVNDVTQKVKFYESDSVGSGYSKRWLVTTGANASLKAVDSNNFNCYLAYVSSAWRAPDGLTNLSIFSVEEDAATFVTAMNNLACDDYVNGPAKTDKEASEGHSSWESIEAAYTSLYQPTKNYLKTLASDKTKGTIDTVEKALAKYDYIVNKYNKGSTVYSEFITGRDTSGLANNVEFGTISSTINNYPIIIATVLVATLSLTSILLIKKKHK